MESFRRGEPVESTVGILVMSSQVNTIEKYSLKRVAISKSEYITEPSGETSLVTVGCIFVLELPYCQNALGRVFTSCTNFFS